MRKLLIRILATASSLYVTSSLIGGFVLASSWESYLIASIIFILLNAIAAPIIKLLLLPINLLTLGLLRWLSNVIVLYLFDTIYTGLTISAYQFPGYKSSLIALPSAWISLFWTLVISSFIMSLTYSIFSTLFHTD